MRRLACGVLAVWVGLGSSGLGGQARELPPVWPYAAAPLPPGVIPPQAGPQREPPAPDPNAPARGGQPPVLRQAKGSQFQFTQQQVSNGYGPADWFPEDHPNPVPEVVAKGKPGVARACGLCHLPTGRGRPENAPLQGLPYDYIVQQLKDFQQGLRHSAEPRKTNTLNMEIIAKSLTEDEIREAAKYFSSIKVPKYIRVVETETVPVMRIQGEIYFPLDEGKTTEPMGVRIIETPEDVVETQLRNPRSGFIAYAPVGSVKRGEALSTTGGNGKTVACTICHGPDLKGIGTVPNLAGRSPSYLARQIYDIKLGTRRGAMAALMKPVVEKLTDSDIVDIIAYVSSREP